MNISTHSIRQEGGRVRVEQADTTRYRTTYNFANSDRLQDPKNVEELEDDPSHTTSLRAWHKIGSGQPLILSEPMMTQSSSGYIHN
jgi:hypothetical protein